MNKNKNPEVATGNEAGGKHKRFSLAVQFTVFLPEAGSSVPLTGNGHETTLWDRKGEKVHCRTGYKQSLIIPKWRSGNMIRIDHIALDLSAAKLEEETERRIRAEGGIDFIGLITAVRIQIPEKPPHGMTFPGLPVGTKIQTLYGEGFVCFNPISAASNYVASGHIGLGFGLLGVDLIFTDGSPFFERLIPDPGRWTDYLMWYAEKAEEKKNVQVLQRFGLNPSLRGEYRRKAIVAAWEKRDARLGL